MTSNSTGTLILVRHSQPKIVTDYQPSLWTLSDSGRARCHILAKTLAGYYPDVVVSSMEVKAIETGQILATDLNKPLKTHEGLREHARPNVGWFDTVEEFEAQVAAFFQHPRQLVFGSETADEAHRRFSLALYEVIETLPGSNLVVVTHGTVLTLFTTRLTGADPYLFWRGLGMPAYVVVSVPAMKVLEVCTKVGD